MINLKDNYEKNVIPYFLKLGYKNILAMPRIKKVVLNTGVGSFLKRETNGKDSIETIKQDFSIIAGQKPFETKARKSVAGFGTRKGQVLGLKITLRGKRMMDFLERLINLALPRTRDFNGIPLKAFEEGGNATIGLKEHIVFPEVGRGKAVQKIRRIFGFETTIVTTAKNKEECIALFQALGFPLEKNSS